LDFLICPGLLLPAAGAKFDLMMLKKTPLHGFHVEYQARMVPFGGWEMPVQYTSILDEHRAVRERAGLFDVSHMGEVRLHGSQARTFIDHLVTNSLDRLVPGKAVYSPMCQDDGGVVDDLIIYQVGDEEFLLCINAANIEKDVAWIEGHSRDFDCLVDNVSDDFGQLALQGPFARELFQAITGVDVASLKRFAFIKAPFMDSMAIISRTGYTGEDGLEIYAPAGEVARIANHLYEAGKSEGLVLAGLGARDSLRLEAGLPLYGHEISETLDPLTAGLGWAVKLDKAAEFVGKAALSRRKAGGLPQKVIFFVLDDRRIARAETTVVRASGEACGKVLSGSSSPLLQRGIGSAVVATAALDSGEPLFAEIRGRQIPLQPKKPPLHKGS
jgi:aminomethyltransferase